MPHSSFRLVVIEGVRREHFGQSYLLSARPGPPLFGSAYWELTIAD